MVDMDSAPQDVLVEVFRRLAPRGLASCRCVCRAWHATVDANRLLRADLLPLTLDGIFFETSMFSTSRLFSRRSTGRKVTSRLDYLDCPLARADLYWPIMDCCNGLLLLADSDHVVNPATRQWVRFPPPPRSCTATDCHKCFDYRYLVYDPTVSPHYEVFSVPLIPFNLPTGHLSRHICHDDQLVSAME
ncbi:uncharacterized protein [Triticum aestivum]|uniref:uncharacterized protein isoform X2 n=1 Tax=Triticum aestivum TaxID=4565 RepID=UPI001D01013A|nr:uncharacterized protein LOC123150857 isoform X2 [Triticum aestivum]